MHVIHDLDHCMCMCMDEETRVCCQSVRTQAVQPPLIPVILSFLFLNKKGSQCRNHEYKNQLVDRAFLLFQLCNLVGVYNSKSTPLTFGMIEYT